MHALPKIDLQSSPTPAQADAPARTASRSDGDNFAETLHRHTAAQNKPERPTEPSDVEAKHPEKKSVAGKPAEAAGGETPTKPVTNNHADSADSADSASANTDAPAALDVPAAPGEVSVDAEIAALLAASQAAVVVPPEAAPLPLETGDVDPLAALTMPLDTNDHAVVALAAPVAVLTPSNGSASAAVAVAASTAPAPLQQTAAPQVAALAKPDHGAAATDSTLPKIATPQVAAKPTVVTPLVANAVLTAAPTTDTATPTVVTPPVANAVLTAAAPTTTAAAPTMVTPPVANAALTAAPTTDATTPTADTTLVASATPVVPLTTPQPAVKPGATPPSVAADVMPVTTEVDPTAALPPVFAAETVVKNALPAPAALAVPLADDAPLPVAAALASVTPATAATPATQSAAMHTVAAAIGNHQAKEIKAAAEESSGLTGKSTSELAAPTVVTQPITPVTSTRPMSEAVLAQNLLAAQGNAMEKALSHQVTKTLVQHLPNGDRMMTLRLTPPELGTIKIDVIERQGVLSAHLHAEDDGVRLALERFLPSMRQDLRASDAPIRELTLSDQTQFQRSFADGQQGQQQDANRSGNRRGRDDAPRFSIDDVRSDPLVASRTAPLGGRANLSGVDALA